MKKIFKKKIKFIFGLIVGTIISGTCVYAATILYAANAVRYDNTNVAIQKDGVNVTNVQEAIEALYEKANVSKLPTTMSLSSTSGTIGVGESTTITVTTNGDGALSCSTSDSIISSCSVEGTTVTITGAPNQNGTATITVNQASGPHYAQASGTYDLTISGAIWRNLPVYFSNTSDCTSDCQELCELNVSTSVWSCGASYSVAPSSPSLSDGSWCWCYK